ncbi:MAG: hypothetical protein AAFV53_07140 [Myxococcota bacterium]
MILFLGVDGQPGHIWHRLYPQDAIASSYLKSAYNRYDENYHPRYVLDDDPDTAWTEGVDGQGEGEHLTLPLTPVPSVTAVRLRIRNGYQKSAMLLDANGAPQTLRIEVVGSNGRVLGTTVADVERTPGWQDVELSLPTSQTIASLRLEILKVHPGKTYSDGCVSDIQVFVDAPVDAQVQQANRMATMQWKQERQALAERDPKALPDPFSSHRFVRTSQSVISENEAVAAMAPMKRLMARTYEEGTLARGERVDHAPTVRFRLPNGDELSSVVFNLEWLFAPERLHLSETEDAWRSVVKSEDESEERETKTSNVRILRDVDGEVSALTGRIQSHGRRKHASVMRMFWEDDLEFTIRYVDGRPQQMLTSRIFETQEWSLFVFDRNADHQITGFTLYHLAVVDGVEQDVRSRFQAI